jgi:hypothetical protein
MALSAVDIERPARRTHPGFTVVVVDIAMTAEPALEAVPCSFFHATSIQNKQEVVK